MKYKYIFLFLLYHSTDFLYAQVKYVSDSGCYIGAFIMYDKIANTDIKTFEDLTGKKHAGYLNYIAYGSPFPKQWIEYCKANNTSAQIGYEPMGGLEAVTDTIYLKNFAVEANKAGIPIFIRWASEMNIYGDNPWAQGKPTLYIEKFRLVSRIFRDEAPNVIMVWTPNWAPNNIGDSTSSIDPYYPGNDYVDWVGVDFYQWGPYCPYDRGVSDPRDQLRYVYDKYSSSPFNKPIFICEMGISHYDYWTSAPKDVYQYCIDGMDKIYRHLKTEFPKVKAVYWFDVDSHTSNKSNFQLTDDTRVLNNYKDAISDSYYLSIVSSNLPEIELVDFPDSTIVKTKTTFNIKITSQYPVEDVKVFINSSLYYQKSTSDIKIEFDPSAYKDGEYEMKIAVKTSAGISNLKRYTIIIDNNNDYYSQILDNIPGFGFSFSEGWWTSTSQPDLFGTDYYVISAGNGSAKAGWNFNLPYAGNFEIYAWWSQHSNRASNAPYRIALGNSDTIIYADQRLNGGKWNLLGKFNFRSNISSVFLSNAADGFVIADAIKIFRNESPPINNITGINNLPNNFSLRQNYPNPFNPSTRIRFSIPINENAPISENKNISLKVFDILGRVVKNITGIIPTTGEIEYEFDGSNLSGGVYFYQLEYGGEKTTKSMLLLK